MNIINLNKWIFHWIFKYMCMSTKNWKYQHALGIYILAIVVQFFSWVKVLQSPKEKKKRLCVGWPFVEGVYVNKLLSKIELQNLNHLFNPLQKWFQPVLIAFTMAVQESQHFTLSFICPSHTWPHKSCIKIFNLKLFKGR